MSKIKSELIMRGESFHFSYYKVDSCQIYPVTFPVTYFQLIDCTLKMEMVGGLKSEFLKLHSF